MMRSSLKIIMIVIKQKTFGKHIVKYGLLTFTVVY